MQQRSVPNVTRVRLRAWKWSDLCSSVVFGARRRFWSGLGSPRQFITRNLLWFNVAPDKIKCNFLHHGTCKVYTISRERLNWRFLRRITKKRQHSRSFFARWGLPQLDAWVAHGPWSISINPMWEWGKGNCRNSKWPFPYCALVSLSTSTEHWTTIFTKQSHQQSASEH